MTGSRPRLRWLSFSLRSLLLIVTLLAIVLGRWTNSAQEQRNAVATIRDHYSYDRCEYEREQRPNPYSGAGGTSANPAKRQAWIPRSFREWLGKDYFDNIDSVVFGEGNSPKPTPEADRAAWKSLAGIWNLRQLTSYIEPVDDDLAHVARLRHIKSIDLQTSPKLTDDALRSLGCLSQLERLTISGGQYTAAGFKHLVGLRHLKHLGLVSWHRGHSLPRSTDPLVTWLGSERAIEVTDEDLAEIGKLTGLERLRLASTRITDVGLAHLAALTNLKLLEVGATHVTSAGFAHLSRLKNLKQVKLYCPGLSDDGLRFVAEWRQLQCLELYATTIDGSGFQHFAPDSQIASVFIFEGPNITDDAISLLARLANLSQLQLHGTRISGDNLGQLQAAPKLTSLWITPAVEGDMTHLKLQLPNCLILRIGSKDW